MEVTRKELLAWLENNIEKSCYRGFAPNEVEDMVNTWIDLVLYPPGVLFEYMDLWLVNPTSDDKIVNWTNFTNFALPEDVRDDFFNMCQVSKSDLVYYALSDDPICIKVVSSND